jgi:phosphonoacetaldehyde hydrolase
MKAFEFFGLRPTLAETRAPMGLAKRTHLARMLEGERLASAWAEKFGRRPGEAEADALYARFEPALLEVLAERAEPLPGVVETVARLREAGLKIGSTTGYTRDMMRLVTPAAKAAGYEPDALASPDETGGIGRPYPYMLWLVMERLGVEAASGVVKVGDTLADIEEGRNAGCLSLGVIAGSSLLGLERAEFEALSAKEKAPLFETVRRQFLEAGADHVLDDITGLPELISLK